MISIQKHALLDASNNVFIVSHCLNPTNYWLMNPDKNQKTRPLSLQQQQWRFKNIPNNKL